MTPEELKKLGGLYVERVTDGFAQYDSRITHMGEREAAAYMRRLREETARTARLWIFTTIFWTMTRSSGCFQCLTGSSRRMCAGWTVIPEI